MNNKIKISNGMNLRNIAIGALMATALAPFVVIQNNLTPYIGGKILFLKGITFLVISLITFILLFGRNEEKEGIFENIKKMIKSKIFLAVSANILLLILSTIFAYNKMAAFFGEPQRSEGFITIFSIYVLFVCFWLLFSKKEWERFFIVSAFVSIILFFIEVSQIILNGVRPEVLSGNSDFIAVEFLFYITAGLITLYIGRKEKKSWIIYIGYIATAFSFLGMILTKTRSALVGFVIGLFICSVIFILLNKGKIIYKAINFRKLGISIVSIIVFISLIFGFTYKMSFWNKVPGVDRIAEGLRDSSSVNSRFVFWDTSIHIFKSEKNILRKSLGWGWDNYIFAWSKYYNPLTFYYDTAIADRAHNKLFDLLIMTGVFGLISYLSIWYFFIRRNFLLLKNIDITIPIVAIFFGVSYFVALMFSFDIIMTFLFFFIILAFIDKYEKEI